MPNEQSPKQARNLIIEVAPNWNRQHAFFWEGTLSFNARARDEASKHVTTFFNDALRQSLQPQISTVTMRILPSVGKRRRGGRSTPGCGTVFKIDPTGKETVLHLFRGTKDGSTPLAGLLRDSAGHLDGRSLSLCSD